MASQDIISQLRDLQMAIDDFTDLKCTTATSSENYLNQQDTPALTESPSSSSPAIPAQRHYEEKSLIEEKQKSLMDSVLPFQLSADDDFLSLLDQLNDIQLSPTATTTSIKHDLEEHQSEKTLISPTSVKAVCSPKAATTVPATISTATANSTSILVGRGEKHWVEEDTSSNHQSRYNRPPLPNYASCSSFSSSSVSRATSTLSINSRRSTRSYKSMMGSSSNGKQRSAVGTSSSSTITNTNTTKRSANKYHARTYDEMMRIPDIHERIRFYEKTYQLCVRSDSTLATWVKKFKAKEIPKPLLEGYVPPPRPRMMQSSSSYMSIGRSESNHFKMSSSLSGSISMFLRKASSHTSSTKHQIPTTPAIPDGMSRSFGRPVTLDKSHRLAHSMHWSSFPHHGLNNNSSNSSINSVINQSNISSYSPTLPLRHQQYHHRQNQTNRRKSPFSSSISTTSHLTPLTSRVTPMVDHLSPSVDIRGSPNTKSISSPKKLSKIKQQRSLQYSQNNKLQYQQYAPSPSASISSKSSQRSYKKISSKALASKKNAKSGPSPHTQPSLFGSTLHSISSPSYRDFSTVGANMDSPMSSFSRRFTHNRNGGTNGSRNKLGLY